MYKITLVGFLGAVFAAGQTVKPLSALRDDLNAFVPAIVSTAVARSSFNASDTAVEQTQVGNLLDYASQLDASTDSSVYSTVPSPDFLGNTTIPYVFYRRSSAVAAQYGDDSANGTERSLWNLTFSSLAPSFIGDSQQNEQNSSADTTSFPIDTSLLTTTLLTLSASRVSIGRAVALAKLYDANTTPTNMTSPNATFCDLLQSNNTLGVRTALTNRVQEASVRSSVTSFALQATNSISNRPKRLVGSVVELYNLLIDVTTDVEVATMFELYYNGDSGC